MKTIYLKVELPKGYGIYTVVSENIGEVGNLRNCLFTELNDVVVVRMDEVPNQEEIRNKASFNVKHQEDTAIWINGANWMKSQILKP